MVSTMLTRDQLCICLGPLQLRAPTGWLGQLLTPLLCSPQLARGHQVALSSISYVGCSLSVLCLVATLVTFAVLS